MFLILILGIYINNAGQITTTDNIVILPVNNTMQIDGEAVTVTDKALTYRYTAGVLEIETDLIFRSEF